jgi:hypothetical protein
MIEQDFIREKEMAELAQKANREVNQAQAGSIVNKRPNRLQQLRDEQKHLIKRLSNVSKLIEYLEQRDYLQDALEEFDKLDRMY